VNIDLKNNKDLLKYWSLADSRRGRFWLTVRWRAKCLAWIFVVKGSRAVKRSLDIIVASTALLALSPLLLTVMALIKQEDGGPVFFFQIRVGARGRPFSMWKFRSMVCNADVLKEQLLASNEMQGGITFKMKNDPRVTRVGQWIRKFSVDELPQIWNVFVGEMSVVGPRPPVPKEVAQYSPEDRQRLLAKPGLTCFWQVGGRSKIDFDGQVRLDLEYIRSRSFWVDVKLLLKTVPAVLMGDGAY
jgi:lipopolysaccharide/colanic/teichoic acid biosynthesis glycosyltransferase